jgi:hypothetical protein
MTRSYVGRIEEHQIDFQVKIGGRPVNLGHLAVGAIHPEVRKALLALDPPITAAELVFLLHLYNVQGVPVTDSWLMDLTSVLRQQGAVMNESTFTREMGEPTVGSGTTCPL